MTGRDIRSARKRAALRDSAMKLVQHPLRLKGVGLSGLAQPSYVYSPPQAQNRYSVRNSKTRSTWPARSFARVPLLGGCQRTL